MMKLNNSLISIIVVLILLTACEKEDKAVYLASINTLSVTEINATSAKSGGIIVNNGGGEITSRGIVWHTAATPTNQEHTGIKLEGTGEGVFESFLVELAPNTQYYIRAFAANSAGISYGNSISFATLGQLPTVTTTGLTNISHDAATSGGNVLSSGGNNVSSRGVVWSVNPLPELHSKAIKEAQQKIKTETIKGPVSKKDNDYMILTKDSTISKSVSEGGYTINGNGIGSFTSHLTDLKPSTRYYIRAYAVNTEGISYGETISFTTSAIIYPPEITTVGVYNITHNTATGNATVTSEGGGEVVQRGFAYSTSENPTISSHTVQAGTGSGSFIVTMSNLIENTTYYARAYATNSAGTSYGDQFEFKTKTNYGEIPFADFSVQPVIGTVPLTVNFTDLSTGNPSNWYWEFGDGEYSSLQNPRHTYHTPGIYSVRLLVTNNYGQHTLQKRDLINVTSGGMVGEPCPGMPIVTDIDGNSYNTVLIGQQCWLKENLKTTKYRNGVVIDFPGNNDDAWYGNTTGAYAWYENNIVFKDAYGALYNFYAASNTNGLCPAGWRVSTYADWDEMTIFLIENSDVTTFQNVGNKLKSCRQVNSPHGNECNTTVHPRWMDFPTNHGTDDFGFSALPGGKGGGAFFDYLGSDAYWWAMNFSGGPIGVYMIVDGAGVGYNSWNVHLNEGRSVRCIKE